LPLQRGVVAQRTGENAHVRRLRRSARQRGERGGVEARNVRDILEVDELQQVAVLDSMLNARGLVLMIVVFAPFSEADRSNAQLIEWGMVPSPQEAVAAELEDSGNAGIGLTDVRHGTRQLPRGRVALIAQGRDEPGLLRGRGCR